MKVLFSHLLGTTFQNMYSGSTHGVRPFDENSANVADYLHDSLFHGLRSILGEDVVDHIEMWHMYVFFHTDHEYALSFWILGSWLAYEAF